MSTLHHPQATHLVPARWPSCAHDLGLAREVLVLVVIDDGVHGELGGPAGRSSEGH